MQIKNETGLEVSASPQFVRSDATILTVVVKGTFIMNDQGQPVQLAQQQRSILWGDELYDSPAGCVRQEGELLPFKPAADVIVVGKAIAPGGQAALSLPVSARVGTLEKKLAVFGDRWWKKDSGMPPKVTAAEPFTEMELSYERAFGGCDMDSGTVCLDNPIGQGIVDDKAKILDKDVALPNIEDPDNLITTWQDRPEPAGYGVVGRGWPSRLTLMGTYDEAWQTERAPDPPEDFSSAYYNCASPGLVASGFFAGSEEVEVHNMSANGRWACLLPGLAFTASVVRADSDSDDPETLMDSALPTVTESLALSIDTVVLFPTEGELTVIWRGFSYIKSFSAAEVRTVDIQMQPIT